MFEYFGISETMIFFEGAAVEVPRVELFRGKCTQWNSPQGMVWSELIHGRTIHSGCVSEEKFHCKKVSARLYPVVSRKIIL